MWLKYFNKYNNKYNTNYNYNNKLNIFINFDEILYPHQPIDFNDNNEEEEIILEFYEDSKYELIVESKFFLIFLFNEFKTIFDEQKLKLLTLNKYIFIYNNIFNLHKNKKFVFLYANFSFLIFNLKTLKVLINFFINNKLLINVKPGLIKNKLNLEEKKYKKSWKILKFMIQTSLQKIYEHKLVFYSNDILINFKGINSFLYRILHLINYFIVKSEIFSINTNLKLFNNNKKIKSIKKKFKKKFQKKSKNVSKFL